MESKEEPTKKEDVKLITAEIEIVITPDPKEEEIKRKCDKRATICLLLFFFLVILVVIGIILDWVMFVFACMWLSAVFICGFVYFTFLHKCRREGIKDPNYVDKYGYL